MSKEQLLERLRAARVRADDGDCEEAHREADAALLEFIADDEVWAAFAAIKRWYS